MPPPAGARCAQHADVAAVDLCQRCGSFVCSGCIEIRDEDVYCSTCAALLDAPPSRLSRTLVWLSASWLLFLVAAAVLVPTQVIPPVYVGLSVMATVPLSAVMVALWIVERVAQRRATPSRLGRRRLTISAVLIVINILISVAVLAGFALFIVRTS